VEEEEFLVYKQFRKNEEKKKYFVQLLYTHTKIIARNLKYFWDINSHLFPFWRSQDIFTLFSALTASHNKESEILLLSCN
jgi:hypothetical protein